MMLIMTNKKKKTGNAAAILLPIYSLAARSIVSSVPMDCGEMPS